MIRSISLNWIELGEPVAEDYQSAALRHFEDATTLRISGRYDNAVTSSALLPNAQSSIGSCHFAPQRTPLTYISLTS
jgi:hypothetical protein